MRESTNVQAVTGFVLCVAAAGYVRFAKKAVRKFEDEERRRTEFAQQPWKWRQEWCEPVITSKDRAGVGLAWLLAIVVCGISAPVAYAIATDPNIPKPVYLAMIFPVVGVILLGSAIYKTLQWRKFGATRLVLSTIPGSIGGYLGGIIEVPARVALERDASLALHCIRRVTTGGGKNRQTTEDVLWEREERIPAGKWVGGSGRTEIPVLFHIPLGQPATDLDTLNNQVIWRLTATAEVPGVDFSTTFDVPVFETGQTAPPPEAGRPALDIYRPPTVGEREFAEAGISHEARIWKFHPQLWLPRGISAVVAILLTAVLWAFVGNSVPWVVWAVTSFFALIAWVWVVEMWFTRTELRVEGEEVTVRQWRWRGLRERRIRRTDIAGIRADRSMRAGAVQYHHLVLVGRGADPSEPASPDEPFRTRKARYQLRQLGRELGVDRPGQMGERGAELTRLVAALPRFELQFAKHVRGVAVADAVRQMVEAEIRGKAAAPRAEARVD